VTAEPTLADDEARLAEIAAGLEQSLLATLPVWLEQQVRSRLPDVDSGRLAAEISATMAEFASSLARVLRADVDDGAGNPLAVVRAATVRVTQLLREGGAVAVARDEFDVRAFPDDLYGLGPAAFVDVDESLHEPGLMWGAARAHVHLRRRRERTT